MQFRSESAAENHMKVKGHYENYCQDCKKKFISANNLRMVPFPYIPYVRYYN